jgi:hypothetical protein
MAFGDGGNFDRRTKLKKGYGSSSPLQMKWIKERRDAKKRKSS